MVTVLLMNYKRAQNLPVIIDALKNQTVPCKIFLWNNSETSFEDDRLDLVIDSSKNLKCWPRWSMAAYADTPYVMTHDDDLKLNSKDCLETLINSHKKYEKPGLAIGFNGVRLGDDLSYYPNDTQKKLRKIGITKGAKHVKFPQKDTTVDVIKGRLILCKREDLRNFPLYVDCQDCDDIVVSSHLAKGKRNHHVVVSGLRGKVLEMDEMKKEFAVSSRPDWQTLRSSLSKTYFKETPSDN